MLLRIFIVLIILLLFFHLKHQLTTSKENNIFYLDDITKLREYCYFKQPIIFKYNYQDSSLKPETEKITVIDTVNKSWIDMDTSLVKELTNNKDYYFEYDLVSDNEANKLLKPNMTIKTYKSKTYSTISISTLLQYELSYQTIIVVKRGNIKINISPTKIIDKKREKVYKNIHIIYAGKESELIMKQENLSEGMCIYIPTYWWYNLELEKDSEVIKYHYFTPMNIIAISRFIFSNIYQSE